MNNKEIEISKHFKRTSEIAEPCYMGNKYCSTCMHCISDRYSNYIGFEHCYCAKEKADRKAVQIKETTNDDGRYIFQ